jgi:hypothetical protein
MLRPLALAGCAIAAICNPAIASEYRWEKILQAPVDESYFGANDPRNLYDPLSDKHPLAGSEPRRNGGYAWGVTTHGDEIWYGAFMNGWCLWLQPAGLPAPTADTADLYNFRSPINACDLREKNRPPVIQIFDSKSQKLSVYQSDDPRFAAAMSDLVAIRSAATVGDTIFIGALIGGDGAAASGSMDSDDSYFFKGIRVIAINATTKKFLGAVTIRELNESRKMSVIDQPDGTKGLYLGASSRSGKSYLLRWTGSSANPFPAAKDGGYPGFEKVADNSGAGMIGEIKAIKDSAGATRLVVSTWSSWPSVNKSGGLYLSSPMPRDGFHAKAQGSFTPLVILDKFDPDPLLGPTWGGGMLSIYQGKIYWGTMTIGSVYAGAYNLANPRLAMTPAIRDNFARALSSRAAHVFRIDPKDPANPKVELLFGSEYFPVVDPADGSLSYKANLLGLKPLMGDAGFGYGTVNYSWESAVFDDKLFIGTMDYSGGLVDYIANKKFAGDYQINANLRVAKEQGFVAGGDMVVFENGHDQPRIITRDGLGNPDVNGFRNFLILNGSLYVGTSSEANMGPTAGYAFYRLQTDRNGPAKGE